MKERKRKREKERDMKERDMKERERDETINLINSGKWSRKITRAGTIFVGKEINWELCKQVNSGLANQRYMHRAESVLESATQNFSGILR